MNKFLKFGLMAAAFCCFVEPASAASDVVSETRPLDPHIVRVKVDGIVEVVVRQGSPAAMTVRGDRNWIARTSTSQRGDTLNIGTEARAGALHERFMMRESSQLRVELTLPALREVSADSIGTTTVVGFEGDELDLSHEGAGQMVVQCNYKRVSAKLGGIGSMVIKGLSSEGVDLDVSGAGSVSLVGRSKWLRADLGGIGGLNAQQFAVDNVDLELSGLGNAIVTAHQNANLNLSGMGSVTVYGKPANRKLVIEGLGKVNWK
ncbi:hypothetical protein GCM10027321_32750 [Massilia terrae]|uniref:DUF2807 domain-containing protein n=1 Tax=Massilia terrae TaxID=1811224 RepID=A0ABT2CRI4_9BURK|nr:DUF2807 domain-containing protein [Massilia terrae]